MTEPGSMIYVVDDDASVRDGISNLLESVGLQSQVFASAEDFRRAPKVNAPSCLVLDYKLPGQNGLEFQDALAEEGVRVPIIFVTAHGDVPMTARAMKGGAIEFLLKPFGKDELLSAIRHGLERDRVGRQEQAEFSDLQERWQELTPREREVMELVVAGLTNKETASKLGITEVTTKMHRGQVMQKMRADSLAGLVRMADRLRSNRRVEVRRS